MGRPTFLNLFAGIGGLDLGLERAGWSCVGQVEIDPYCQRVLAKHWPQVPRWSDIKELHPDELPRADLICGGFPCQPVSVVGRGLAQEDERWLWPHVARLVRHLRPSWVLLENVPGLLIRGMGDVLGDLAACRYDAEWDCVPASAIGAPHQRDRVWIVAYPQRGGRDGLHERLEPRHVATDPPGRGADGTRRATAEDHRRGVLRQGPQGSDAADAECVELRDQPGWRAGQGRPGQAVAGDDGAAGVLADPEGQRSELRPTEGQRPGRPSSG